MRKVGCWTDLLLIAILSGCNPQPAPFEVKSVRRNLVPLQCPAAYPSWNQSGYFDRDSGRHQRDPNSGAGFPNYANYIDYTATVLFNPNIESVKLHFSSFSTEAGFDYVKFYTAFGGETTYTYTGPAGGWTTDLPLNHDLGKNYAYLHERFVTDRSVTSTGWKVDALQYRCYENPPTNPSNTLLVSTNKEHTGFLIGTGDTILTLS